MISSNDFFNFYVDFGYCLSISVDSDENLIIKGQNQNKQKQYLTQFTNNQILEMKDMQYSSWDIFNQIKLISEQQNKHSIQKMIVTQNEELELTIVDYEQNTEKFLFKLVENQIKMINDEKLEEQLNGQTISDDQPSKQQLELQTQINQINTMMSGQFNDLVRTLSKIQFEQQQLITTANSQTKIIQQLEQKLSQNEKLIKDYQVIINRNQEALVLSNQLIAQYNQAIKVANDHKPKVDQLALVNLLNRNSSKKELQNGKQTLKKDLSQRQTSESESQNGDNQLLQDDNFQRSTSIENISSHLQYSSKKMDQNVFMNKNLPNSNHYQFLDNIITRKEEQRKKLKNYFISSANPFSGQMRIKLKKIEFPWYCGVSFQLENKIYDNKGSAWILFESEIQIDFYQGLLKKQEIKCKNQFCIEGEEIMLTYNPKKLQIIIGKGSINYKLQLGKKFEGMEVYFILDLVHSNDSIEIII